MPPLRPQWSYAIAGVLLALFFAGMYAGSVAKSPAWDEPGHIASGVAYVQLGSLAVNPQHPPLLKALSGLSLTIAGGRWPDTPQSRDLLNGAGQWQWDIGSLILTRAGLDRALQWARLPLMLVATLGGLVVFLWGRRLAGDWAGLGALFLYTLDPTIAAHGLLVTMDAGLGGLTLLFLYCLWSYVRDGRPVMLRASGVVLGLALCAKFSAVLLVPIGVVLLVAGRYRKTPAAVKAGPNDPCPCGSGRKFKNCHSGKAGAGSGGEWLAGSIVPLAWMLGLAAAVVTVIYHGSPGAYLAGMAKVNADHLSNYAVYMAGQMAGNFTTYFAVAYLLKEPIASILLAATGAWLIIRARKLTPRDALFVLFPPVAFFLFHVWKADNLGIRYIIPCLPFAHLLGGIALVSLLEGSTAKRIAAGLLAVWVAVAAVGIHPDGLSYFNESACLLDSPGKIGLDGGSRCGAAWLDDSNLDWGMGLKQLKSWLAVNAPGRTAKLGYFGSFPAEAYGLPVELVPDQVLRSKPASGLWVVSAHKVAHLSAQVAHNQVAGDQWMPQTPPRAVVGHCLYIYDLGR